MIKILKYKFDKFVITIVSDDNLCKVFFDDIYIYINEEKGEKLRLITKDRKTPEGQQIKYIDDFINLINKFGGKLILKFELEE